MNKGTFLTIIVVFAVLVFPAFHTSSSNRNSKSQPNTESQRHTKSPYSGQEAREIKSLSREDIDSLNNGTGIAFGGMAKLAELNGYPGPRHVLDLVDQMNLTEEQKTKTKAIYNEMKREAVRLGERIITIEKDMNDRFADKTISDEELKGKLAKSAEIYGQLRYVHLKRHLQMVDILTPEQVAVYNRLRGYTSEDDPCEKVPEGHDPKLWRQHHNCN